ncbi:MAG: dephospho-CoA kinase [Candidatus Sericytochromatia bacterium]|nr:dephospho-CoA kinase [Candidatus Sericytochromatia bacterium]
MSFEPCGEIEAVLVVGLTGGIASGKTAVSDILASLGAVVLDTDLIAREIVEPEMPALTEIKAEFGEDVVAANGRLDRTRLAARVFADPAALGRLNAITHPRIREVLVARLNALRMRPNPPAVTVLVVPLLFEGGLDSWVDETWVVDVPEEIQRSRLFARDGLSQESLEARLAAQMTREERRRRATRIISNDGDRADLERRVREVWKDAVEGRANASS